VLYNHATLFVRVMNLTNKRYAERAVRYAAAAQKFPRLAADIVSGSAVPMNRSLIVVAALAAATTAAVRRASVGAVDRRRRRQQQSTCPAGVDGAPLVAWVRQDGNVFVARRSAEGTFAKPVRANDVAGEAAPHEQAPAQIAVGRDGHAYVIWQTRIPIAGRRFPASDLRFARSTDGGQTFEPARTINDDAGGQPTSHTFHDLYVDREGTVFASWIDGRTTETARRHSGGGHGGHAKAAGEPLGPEIRVAKSTDGGVSFSAWWWITMRVRAAARRWRARPMARCSSPGGRFTRVTSAIVVARSTDGGATFGEAVRVHNDGWVYPGCPHAESLDRGRQRRRAARRVVHGRRAVPVCTSRVA
jgi:hypothetical protein